MFDSAPPNLPVEPSAQTPASPPPRAPSAAPAAAPMPQMSKGKKEPEDIFSGLDQGPPAAGGTVAPSMDAAPRRGFPVKAVVIIIVAILVLGGGGFAVWAFLIAPTAVTPPVVPSVGTPVVPAPPVAVTPTTTVPTPVVEQPPTAEEQQAEAPPVTTPPPGTNIPLPTPIAPPAVVAPTEGTDTDGDALTDTEEVLYTSNPSIADTDGDGYNDGSEVQNLFSPVAANKSLASESFMQTLGWNGWSFLAPSSWGVSPDANNPQAAALITGSATKFDLLVRPNPSQQSLADFVGGDTSGMRSFKTKGGFDALQSADGLTTYVAHGDSVLVVTYDLNGDPSYDYRTTYAMFLNSLAVAQ